MFTGLVTAVGRLQTLHKGSPALLVLDWPGHEQVKIGDSVAVNGICLTVTTISGPSLSFNLLAETLKRSNLADLSPGSRLNLELPLKAGDFLGGHLVSGHLDGTARLTAIRSGKGGRRCRFTYIEPGWRKLIINKGSITINGISLTVAACSGSSFEIEVIPHTWENTNLQYLKRGDRVNVELDLMGKYLYNFYISGKNDSK